MQVPPNGLVIYTGTVLTDDGKEKKLNIDFEPFKPINTSLYLCDNKFHTEALNELLESDSKCALPAAVVQPPAVPLQCPAICIYCQDLSARAVQQKGPMHHCPTLLRSCATHLNEVDCTTKLFLCR